MKKTLIILLSSFFALSAFSQDETTESASSGKLSTKKGFVILPEAGDYAIGIDATPVLNYVGNVFTNATNTAPGFGFTVQNPGRIYGKKYITDSYALRGSIILGYSNSTEKIVNIEESDVTDKFNVSALKFGVTLGIEQARTYRNRLIGFYGVQGILTKDPGTATVVIPTPVDPNDTRTATGTINYSNGNETDFDFVNKGGSTIAFGGGVFVGVEYFLLPKLSIGGEFDVNLLYSTTGKRIHDPEGDSYDVSRGASGINLDNAASGNIKLMFYF